MASCWPPFCQCHPASLGHWGGCLVFQTPASTISLQCPEASGWLASVPPQRFLNASDPPAPVHPQPQQWWLPGSLPQEVTVLPSAAPLPGTLSLRVPAGSVFRPDPRVGGTLTEPWCSGEGAKSPLPCFLNLPVAPSSPQSCPGRCLTRQHRAALDMGVGVSGGRQGDLNSNCSRETRQDWSLGAFNYSLILLCLEKGFFV